MQNWNVILLNLISFSHLVAPAERFLYGCYWDPTPERRVPWGYVTGTLRQSVGFPGASYGYAMYSGQSVTQMKLTQM